MALERGDDSQSLIVAEAARYFETKVILDGDAELDLKKRVPVKLHESVRIQFGHLLLNHCQRNGNNSIGRLHLGIRASDVQ